MKDFTKVLYFLIVVIVFALYENAEQLQILEGKYELEGSGGGLTLYTVLMTLLCGSSIFFNKRPQQYFSTIFIVLILYISFFSLIFTADININGMVMLMASVLMPIFYFWYFYSVAEKIEYVYVTLCMVVCVAFLVKGYIETYQLIAFYSLTDMVVNSASYTILFLMPFFLLSQNRIVRIVSLMLVAALMLSSLKRGGFLALGLGAIFYFMVEETKSRGGLKVKRLLAAIALIAVVYFGATFFMDTYFDNMFDRLSSIEDDRGSNRLDIYEDVWHLIVNSDFTSLVVGHGRNTVKDVSATGYSAHNDFLEVIYDFGIIGFTIYIMFFAQLYRTMFRLVKKRSANASVFAFSVAVFTTQSIVAHVIIYDFNIIAFSAVWGYILGKEKIESRLLLK